MNRQDFQQIANLRLRETQVLLKARQYSGAYYLGGYVIECALKACVAKQTRRYDFPDKDFAYKSYTHDLVKLIDTANLKDELAARRKADESFDANWKTVILWSEQSRYNRSTQIDAQRLYDSISDPLHGVLQWLKLFW